MQTDDEVSLIKQENKNTAGGTILLHCVLMFVYIFFMLTIIGDGETLGVNMLEPAVLFTAMFIGIEVCAVIVVLFARLLIPHLQRRSAAFRALGQHGVSKTLRDPMARLAYKGVYAMLEDDFPKAEEYLNLAMSRSDVNQNKLFCIEWLIKLYEETGADDKLLWCYRKAVEFAPEIPSNQARLGHAYYVDGKLEQAMYCFQQALRYNPNEGFALYSIAKIQLIRGEDDKALETLESLEKVNSSHPLVYAELAIYWAMHDDDEKSDSFYQKAVLCGHNEQEYLYKQLDAIKRLRRGETFDGDSLPSEFYRRIEKEESQAEKE